MEVDHPRGVDRYRHDRKRFIRSCDTCRTRKVKCDRNTPCQKCVSSQYDCTYSNTPQSKGSEPRPRSIKPKSHASPTDSASINSPSSKADANEKHRELRAGISAFNSETQAYQFYGPSSHFSFVQRLHQRILRQSNKPMISMHKTIPEGLERWGVHHQMFPKHEEQAKNDRQIPEGSILPRDLGDDFIKKYFTVIHPQAPILDEVDVCRTWGELFEIRRYTQTAMQQVTAERSILYLVLAIGACLSNRCEENYCELWAELYFDRACSSSEPVHETCLRNCHVLTLKAIYSMQISRTNWIYLYTGQAVRSAMALGLHSSQALSSHAADSNRSRATFWTIYFLERITCLHLGRPTCLVDHYIDAPFPEDATDVSDVNANSSYAYIRAMIVVGKISHTLLMAAYSPNSVKTVQELPRMNQLNNKCVAELQRTSDSLPPNLKFLVKQVPIGHSWQEVQRTSLGLTYHLVRLLIFRPSLIYASFFPSLAAAQESIGDMMNLKTNIENSMSSSKMIIDLAHDSFFRRCPPLCRDGNLASAVVTACLTLLFDVLDAETTTSRANEVFGFVDKGLECLRKADHIGSTTGSAISMEVMKIAKDAIFANEFEAALLPELSHNFAWLNDTTLWEHDEQTDSGGGPLAYGMLGDMGFNEPSQLQPAPVVVPRAADPRNSQQLIMDLMGESFRFPGNSYGGSYI